MIGKVKNLFKRKDNTEDVLLKSRDLGDGRYIVGGIHIQADSHAEAIHKYRTANNLQTKDV